jgi:class 3 adenylate cyclase
MWHRDRPGAAGQRLAVGQQPASELGKEPVGAGRGAGPCTSQALHLGEILWGSIGAADRLDFTAIGPAVNLVSRLEGLRRPLGRSVLISGAVAAETTTPLVPLGEHMLRGIAAPCAVFTLPDA